MGVVSYISKSSLKLYNEVLSVSYLPPPPTSFSGGGLIFAHFMHLAGYWFCWPDWSGQRVNPLIDFYFLARKGLAQLTPEKLKSILLHYEILRVTLNRHSRNKDEEQRSKHVTLLY